jgi:lipoprotein-anchoring transpeptidase ErfK/SrfK
MLASASAGAAPAPPAPGERIAAGVGAAGVDLSGLTVDEAAQRLESLRPRLEHGSVAVEAADLRFRLRTADAHVAFDPLRTAKRALYAGRAVAPPPAPPPAPPVPGAPPAPPAPPAAGAGVEVPLAVTLSQRAVRRFAGRVDRRLRRAARDSRIVITLRRVRITHSRTGRDIDGVALASQVGEALVDPRVPRVFKPALRKVKPKLTADRARRLAGTVITIDQSSFTLRLFKSLRLRKSYKVAVGQPAYPTPNGRYAIQSKQVNPVWSVPNSPWAGELAGTTVGGGSAANPLKARWMGIANGVGIHGTGQDYSIGTRASHGCIRMHVSDVIALYRRVPVGTPVLIGR